MLFKSMYITQYSVLVQLQIHLIKHLDHCTVIDHLPLGPSE